MSGPRGIKARDPYFLLRTTSHDSIACVAQREKWIMGQGVDKPGLVTHAKPLEALLSVCTTSFPLHSSLRAAFVEFDFRYNIFQGGEKSRFKTASLAADVWRKMMKDLHGLSKVSVPPNFVFFAF